MFKKLKEIAEGRTDLLTIRCSNAWLERNPEPTIFVELNDEMEVLISSRDRREHFKTASPWLAEQLEKWRNSDVQKITVATKEYPLEIFAGDTALILVIEGKRYLYSAHRDIYPKGWLLPGGCSRSREELLNPRILMSRECAEEVLITDQEGKIYNFSNSINEMMENVKAWQKEGSLTPGNMIPLSVKELSLAKGDVRNIVIRLNGQESKIENIAVTIDAKIAEVSTCIYLEAVLPIKLNELRLFDGEKLPDKTLLNRPIKLTDEQGDCPALFSRGNNLFISGWVTPATAEKAFVF
ncbi:MAG: hypothetical protein NTU58_01355 [Candidatus Nealsonbacteria bacterium]|nr:hypothetical protein [Candidatus Nealsonbacteria bacterium]